MKKLLLLLLIAPVLGYGQEKLLFNGPIGESNIFLEEIIDTLTIESIRFDKVKVIRNWGSGNVVEELIVVSNRDKPDVFLLNTNENGETDFRHPSFIADFVDKNEIKKIKSLYKKVKKNRGISFRQEFFDPRDEVFSDGGSNLSIIYNTADVNDEFLIQIECDNLYTPFSLTYAFQEFGYEGFRTDLEGFKMFIDFLKK